MPDINRLIDEQLHYVRNIGCVVKIVDEEYNEETQEEFDVFIEQN